MSSARLETPITPRRKRFYKQQSPRKHKQPVGAALRGIKILSETVDDIKVKVTKKLKLTFEMDAWQAHMIHRIRQGYDSILIAGTGYGKSLIFQGLAVIDAKKIVIVICPLKALEQDQVCIT